MPKVEQFEYLSEQANELRHRDGTRPWEIHICEIDSLGEVTPDSGLYRQWLELKALREQIESED